jgi:hypothetical protein
LGKGDVAEILLQNGANINYTTGNVGIGTTTPGQRLTVVGTIESTLGGIKFPDGSTQTTSADSLQQMVDILPNRAPASPDSSNDEFSGSTLDPKWTIYTDVPSLYSVSVGAGLLKLEYTSKATNTNRLLAVMQPAPSGTWRYRAKTLIEGTLWNYYGGGFFVRRSSTNKNHFFGFIKHTSWGDGLSAVCMRFTGTTHNSEVDLTNTFQQVLFLEVENDGTNIIYRTSTSGINYKVTYTEALATHLGGAPDFVGLNLHPYNGLGLDNPMISVDWFRRVQ